MAWNGVEDVVRWETLALRSLQGGAKSRPQPVERARNEPTAPLPYERSCIRRSCFSSKFFLDMPGDEICAVDTYVG